MFIYLGKRYIEKWENKSKNRIKNDIDDLNLFSLFEKPVARSIMKIAFDGF
jgi:hypothetical protein